MDLAPQVAARTLALLAAQWVADPRAVAQPCPLAEVGTASLAHQTNRARTGTGSPLPSVALSAVVAEAAVVHLAVAGETPQERRQYRRLLFPPPAEGTLDRP